MARVIPWLLQFHSSPEITMAFGQHHNDGDEDEVEGAQGQDDHVLPLEEQGVFLSLTVFLSLLLLDSHFLEQND